MIRNVENGDIKTSGVQFAEGRAATAQSVAARLKMFLGESAVDITQGTPWFQSILGKTPQDVAEATIKQRIITTPGVAQIRRFSFSPDLTARALNISATVVSETGEEAAVAIDEVVI